MREALNSTKNLILIFVLIWFMFTFFLGIKMAPNDDMSPRISAGDILLYYRLNKTPTAQKVVVLKKNDTFYVGRVVAVGGDTVEITKDSNLVINGNTVIEERIFYKTSYFEGFVDYPVTLKDGEYFILVDKRVDGEDSRYYGVVSQNEIKGVVIGQFRRSYI